jgi:hypothetical protein
MTLRILRLAIDDLRRGKEFYDQSGDEVGDYFLQCLEADIESLKITHGVHRRVCGFFRLISERFPFAVYYDVEGDRIDVWRVMDLRSDPKRINRELRRSRRAI